MPINGVPKPVMQETVIAASLALFKFKSNFEAGLVISLSSLINTLTCRSVILDSYVSILPPTNFLSLIEV